jgi:DNA polymerase IV
MAANERQIVHVDMDAYYASVEIRDNPWLEGQPVIVGGVSSRGVVCAASYEARKFGVHSAMPMKTARRLCPNGVFLKTRINHYKEVSRQIRRILDEYTDLIEPLSLDECYLDVTTNKKGIVTGFEVAREIKKAIRERLQLTASAGVGPCKFLAKIASDLKKPDGLVVVRADEAEAFLAPLPVDKIPGVGEHMRKRLAGMNIHTIGQLAETPPSVLDQVFGKWGMRLYGFAHGIDPRPVNPEQETKSISREETFEFDTTDLAQIRGVLAEQAEALGRRLSGKGIQARTVTLKIKYADFSSVTRSVSHDTYFRDAKVIRDQAFELLKKTEAGGKPARLAGLGVSNFWADDAAVQLSLFDLEPDEA